MMFRERLRQYYNWMPPLANSADARIKRPPRGEGAAQFICRCDIGVDWKCGMVDQTTLEVWVTWDAAQVSKMEMEGYVGELLEICGSLAREENWGRVLLDFL